jgi:hypothetical protein
VDLAASAEGVAAAVAEGIRTGDLVRVHRDSALRAVETATVVRVTASGAPRLHFEDGHECVWRHGGLERITAA